MKRPSKGPRKQPGRQSASIFQERKLEFGAATPWPVFECLISAWWQNTAQLTHILSVQQMVSLFGELLLQMPELRAFRKRLEKHDDDYMPSFPPTSPVTGSHFAMWTQCDLRISEDGEKFITNSGSCRDHTLK